MKKLAALFLVLVLTAGVGVYYGRYLVDLSVESHPVLGLTPHLSLSVCF